MSACCLGRLGKEERERGRRCSAPRTGESRLRQRPAKRAAPRARKLEKKRGAGREQAQHRAESWRTTAGRLARKQRRQQHSGSELAPSVNLLLPHFFFAPQARVGLTSPRCLGHSESECENASRWVGRRGRNRITLGRNPSAKTRVALGRNVSAKTPQWAHSAGSIRDITDQMRVLPERVSAGAGLQCTLLH